MITGDTQRRPLGPPGQLEPAPGQTGPPHGPDRNRSVDEIGGIQLVESAAAADA
jgi:hypothetical protein